MFYEYIVNKYNRNECFVGCLENICDIVIDFN